MFKNKIRELRKGHALSQENFAALLGTTQQTISRMETGICDIPTDLLIGMAAFFNVTTDYILGVSEFKRDHSGQMRMDQALEQYYDILLRYQHLNDIDKKTLLVILERLEQAQIEISQKDNLQKKEVKKDGENSNMR